MGPTGCTGYPRSSGWGRALQCRVVVVVCGALWRSLGRCHTNVWACNNGCTGSVGFLVGADRAHKAGDTGAIRFHTMMLPHCSLCRRSL
jgi:hypothetical protein